MKQVFKLKNRNPHPGCVIYDWVCVCGQTYISKTGQNIELRWEEHENTSKDFKPGKYLKKNLRHNCFWKILSGKSENKRIYNIPEASEIAWKRPSLIEKIESNFNLTFFLCNSATWEFCNF